MCASKRKAIMLRDLGDGWGFKDGEFFRNGWKVMDFRDLTYLWHASQEALVDQFCNQENHNVNAPRQKPD